MVIGLKEAIDTFCTEIKESLPDYVSIYTYFVDYMNTTAYSENIELEEFLKNEFSKGDIINSCVYYFEKSNAIKESAILKYLNSMTKFYTSFMKVNGYDNKNLFAILPFSQLKYDVKNKIKDKDLKEKEVCPPITCEDYKLICKYLNEKNKPSITHKQTCIIFKLIMLYGLKLERIKYLEKDDFDFSQRLLTLKTDNENTITLELPYSLSLEISDYLKDTRCNQTNYMFVNTNNKIIASAFLSNAFNAIKNKFKIGKNVNRFTATGLAKYAIIEMLHAGVNVPVIKLVTGMEDDVINDCTREEYNLNDPIKLNRYINSKARYVETYDTLGILESVKLNLESIRHTQDIKFDNSNLK